MTHPLRMRICLPVIAAAITAVVLPPAAASAADVVPGQVIVGYHPGSSTAARADARAETGTKPIEGLGMAATQLVKVTDGDSVAATVRQLESQPGVAYAEPNQILQPASLPNDPEFLDGNQWGLFNDGQTVNGVTGIPNADIEATAAWNTTTGIAPGAPDSPIVAVMDTGADLQHLDLANELWTNPADPTVDSTDDDSNGIPDDVHGADFIGDAYHDSQDTPGPPDGDPSDLSGHGTHVSGIALAQGNNGIGTTGVAQHASLMSLRICGPYDSGCPNSALIAAINYAGDHGARVANGSIAGGGPSQAVTDALAAHPGTLYVFAAGNGDSNGNGVNNDAHTNFPCTADQGPTYSADNVICVAATNQSDRRADFSNYGASSVDLGAPGVNIYSTSSRTIFPVDGFETGDIASWTNTGGSTWAASSEDPHNDNFGITDSPGGDYAPGTTNQVTSSTVTIPSGYSTCELDYFRSVALGTGDQFEIDLLRNGVADPDAKARFTSSSSWQKRFFDLNNHFQPGDDVQVQLTLTSDASPATVADGVHMDDINLVCHGSPSNNGYEFLDGTSMATPMVSGAAALLFADDSAATASEVKTALLSSVDPVPDLAGSTTSGGRLNVYRALLALPGASNPAGGGGGGSGQSSSGTGSGSSTASARKPDTFFKRKPGRVVRRRSARARIVFRFGADQAGSSFRCKLDSVKYKPCAKRMVRRLAPGRHVLKVRAVNSSGAEDPTAAVAKFRVKRIGA